MRISSCYKHANCVRTTKWGLMHQTNFDWMIVSNCLSEQVCFFFVKKIGWNHSPTKFMSAKLYFFKHSGMYWNKRPGFPKYKASQSIIVSTTWRSMISYLFKRLPCYIKLGEEVDLCPLNRFFSLSIKSQWTKYVAGDKSFFTYVVCFNFRFIPRK